MPGVDEADVNGALRAGFLDTQGEGVAKAQFFRNGEGRHVTQFGVAIDHGTGASQHASQVFDIFHGAHQVAKVGTIEFVAGNMDKIFIGEFTSNSFSGIHEAEGGCDDHIKTFSSQRAGNLLRIDTFRYVFNIGCVDTGNVILNPHATDVVGL